VLISLLYLLISIPLVTLGVLVCIYWLDKPVALFGYSHFYTRSNGEGVADFGAFLTLISFCLMLICLIIYYFIQIKGVRHRMLDCFKLSAIAFMFTFFAKNTLKFIFARETPIVNGHLSFLMNQVPDQFHFFQQGANSFPSGHMAMFCALALPVALFYPKKWLILLLSALGVTMAVVMVLYNMHFVSDIIGGAYVGTTIALAVYYLNQKLTSSPS
jgi:membrane-associated phospholipid phosphatase